MRMVPTKVDGIEEWRRVLDCLYYEVSDQAHVRSLDRIDRLGRLRQGRTIKLQDDSYGYLYFQVWENGVDRRVYVHVAMLEAFKGRRPVGAESRHLNDIHDDNRLENLEWGTPSENQQDRVRNGHHHHANKTECPRGHRLEEPNLVPSVLKRGRRDCLACSRAQSYLIKHPEQQQDFVIIAHGYYDKIVEEERLAADRLAIIREKLR